MFFSILAIIADYSLKSVVIVTECINDHKDTHQ